MRRLQNLRVLVEIMILSTIARFFGVDGFAKGSFEKKSFKRISKVALISALFSHRFLLFFTPDLIKKIKACKIKIP